MSLNHALSEIINTPTVSGAFSSLQSKAVAIGVSLVAIFFLLNIGYNVAKKQISMFNATKIDEIKIIDFEMAVRSIVLVILIGIYPSISSFVASSVNTINSMSEPKLDQRQDLVDNFMDMYEKQGKFEQLKTAYKLERIKNLSAEEIAGSRETINLQQAEALKTIANSEEMEAKIDSFDEGVWDKISNGIDYLSHPSIWVLDIVNAIAKIILGFLRVIITLISVYLFKFLLAVGPIAIAFSLIPAFKNQINTWFTTTINVGLVVTTLNFLDHLVYEITERMGNLVSASGGNYDNDWNDTLAQTALYVAVIAMYMSAFWLTSKIVGTGDGGRVMGKAGLIVGGAVAGVTMAGKVGGGAAGQAVAASGDKFKSAATNLKE